MALFLAAVPRVIGFLLILIIGWFIANLISRLVAGLLRRVNFNSLADRSGLTGFVVGMGVGTRRGRSSSAGMPAPGRPTPDGCRPRANTPPAWPLPEAIRRRRATTSPPAEPGTKRGPVF
jgi:hypothetical protein